MKTRPSQTKQKQSKQSRKFCSRDDIKDRQGFVDAIVLISVPDWSVKLLNFENVPETPFVFGL